MITGDKSISVPGTPGFARFELQRSQVEDLALVYWGRGNLWPKLPKGHFDIVTAQDPFWRGLFAWYVSRLLHARLNIQVHADLDAQSFIKKIVARFVLNRASSVRVVSERVKKQVEVFGVRAPIQVLPVYLDIERFRGLQRQPGLQKTILWVGRFETEKDPLRAISVLKEVRESGVDAKLIMLGSGSMEHKLKQRAQRLPVEFPGWQDSAAYLGRADVVLSTSLHESWGASIVEALAAGVPTVAPDVGIAHEAGAIVVSRQELAQALTGALRSDTKVELKLQLLTREEWGHAWKESLLL